LDEKEKEGDMSEDLRPPMTDEYLAEIEARCSAEHWGTWNVIASVRSDIPLLIAETRRLREENDEITATYEMLLINARDKVKELQSECITKESHKRILAVATKENVRQQEEIARLREVIERWEIGKLGAENARLQKMVGWLCHEVAGYTDCPEDAQCSIEGFDDGISPLADITRERCTACWRTAAEKTVEEVGDG